MAEQIVDAFDELPSHEGMSLLICGHHRLVLDALGMALTDHGHTVVATALDPEEAIGAAEVHQPDACLLDVDFPHAHELNPIGRILEVSPDTKVVILSGNTTCSFATDAIAEGVHGIVGKEKCIGDIIAALAVVHRGQLAMDPPLLRAVFRRLAERDDPLRALKSLAEREWDVLQAITDGLTTEETASRTGLRPNTVRAIVKTLFTKLGVHTRLQAAALMAAHASVDTWPARKFWRTKR